MTQNPFAGVVQIADPLVYLPVSGVAEFRKGSVIYGAETAPPGLFLVVSGKVKICRTAHDGRQVVLDVYQTDDFFGEASIVNSLCGEMAAALERTQVMSWSTTEIREILTSRPHLSLSLLQLSIHRGIQSGERIASFSLDNIERRLLVALLRLAEKLGSAGEDGGSEMMAFTHECLAQHVGTSREIVTNLMNHFRRKGCLNYSRKSITVFEDAIRALLSVGQSSRAA